MKNLHPKDKPDVAKINSLLNVVSDFISAGQSSRPELTIVPVVKTRKCPHCAQLIAFHAPACRYCYFYSGPTHTKSKPTARK